MTKYYFDIETNGLDPTNSKILTIQYVELERNTGKQIGDLTILKCWEMTQHEMLIKFAKDVSIYDKNVFEFIPVGYNLDFENKFLKYFSRFYSMKQIDLSLRPKIDLFSIGILMNQGEFKGSSLDQFTSKKQNGSNIIPWYNEMRYDLILDYIENETKGFVEWFERLHVELPLLNQKIKFIQKLYNQST